MKAGSLSRVKRVSFGVRGGVFSLPARPAVAVSDAGGLPDWSPADLAAVVSAGVACLLCRLLPLPLVVFVAPIPPTPFPAGRGRLKVYSAGGYRPRHPGIKPSTALTVPATQAPLRGSGLFSTRIPVAPMCAIALFNSTPKELVFHKQSQCRVPIQPGDARGEAPCMK